MTGSRGGPFRGFLVLVLSAQLVLFEVVVGAQETDPGQEPGTESTGSILDYLEDDPSEGEGEDRAADGMDVYLGYLEGEGHPEADDFDRLLLEDLEGFGEEWDESHDPDAGDDGDRGVEEPAEGAEDAQNLPVPVPEPGESLGPLSENVLLALSSAVVGAYYKAEGTPAADAFYEIYLWASGGGEGQPPTPDLDAEARELLLDELYNVFWPFYYAARGADPGSAEQADRDQFAQLYYRYFYTAEQLAAFDAKTDRMQYWADQVATLVDRQNTPEQIQQRADSARTWDAASQTWRSLFHTGRAVDDVHERIVQFREQGIWANLAMQAAQALLSRPDLSEEDRAILLRLMERYTLARTLAAENIAAELKIVAEGVIADLFIWVAAPRIVAGGVSAAAQKIRGALAGGDAAVATAGTAAAAEAGASGGLGAAARASDEWIEAARQYSLESARRILRSVGKNPSQQEVAALAEKIYQRLLRAPEAGSGAGLTASGAAQIDDFFNQIKVRRLLEFFGLRGSSGVGASASRPPIPPTLRPGQPAPGASPPPIPPTLPPGKIGSSASTILNPGRAAGAAAQRTGTLINKVQPAAGAKAGSIAQDLRALGLTGNQLGKAALDAARSGLPSEVATAGFAAKNGVSAGALMRQLGVSAAGLRDLLIIFVRSTTNLSASAAVTAVERYLSGAVPVLVGFAVFGAAADAEAASEPSVDEMAAPEATGRLLEAEVLEGTNPFADLDRFLEDERAALVPDDAAPPVSDPDPPADVPADPLPPAPPTTRCNNGVLDPGETCDGTDLGGATCESVNADFTGGRLACTSTCTLDDSGCTSEPPPQSPESARVTGQDGYEHGIGESDLCWRFEARDLPDGTVLTVRVSGTASGRGKATVSGGEARPRFRITRYGPYDWSVVARTPDGERIDLTGDTSGRIQVGSTAPGCP